VRNSASTNKGHTDSEARLFEHRSGDVGLYKSSETFCENSPRLKTPGERVFKIRNYVTAGFSDNTNVLAEKIQKFTLWDKIGHPGRLRFEESCVSNVDEIVSQRKKKYKT
jgi:hypothetical protein